MVSIVLIECMSSTLDLHLLSCHSWVSQVTKISPTVHSALLVAYRQLLHPFLLFTLLEGWAGQTLPADPLRMHPAGLSMVLLIIQAQRPILR